MSRLVKLVLAASVLLLGPTLYMLSGTRPSSDTSDIIAATWDRGLLSGNVIMPKLANATAKAELGRASWKLLHTMAQRYPEAPTSEQRETYAAFLHLFSRLYPCGECAAEFQALLTRYPPQTGSRTAAAMHLCSLHNMVNERLGKAEYDCAALEGDYDCGCGDEPVHETDASRRRDPITGAELEKG